jgi:hypothetical protein
MRAQAFNHATVFPKGPTAKLLHIWTARSSQGGFYYIVANGKAGRGRGCILRIFGRGLSANRSPRSSGDSSNGYATVFPKGPTAKLLHIWTARSSQGGFYYIVANGKAGRCRALSD